MEPERGTGTGTGPRPQPERGQALDRQQVWRPDRESIRDRSGIDQGQTLGGTNGTGDRDGGQGQALDRQPVWRLDRESIGDRPSAARTLEREWERNRNRKLERGQTLDRPQVWEREQTLGRLQVWERGQAPLYYRLGRPSPGNGRERGGGNGDRPLGRQQVWRLDRNK